MAIEYELNPYKNPSILLSTEEDDAAGGGEGGQDISAPLIDPALFGLTNHVLMEMLRQEEKKFTKGWVPETKPPQKEGASTQKAQQNRIPPHKRFKDSQQFAGIDKKQTPDPQNNAEAQEMYEKHRLTHRPQPSLTSRYVNTPKFTPTGS